MPGGPPTLCGRPVGSWRYGRVLEPTAQRTRRSLSQDRSPMQQRPR
jgi:hypothetical protein